MHVPRLQPDPPGARLRRRFARAGAGRERQQREEKDFPAREFRSPFPAMITYLEGTLVEAYPTHVVVEVHGVGYHVLIPLSSWDRLPPVGAQIKILTHLVVREDAHLLYGFMSTRRARSLPPARRAGLRHRPEDGARCALRHERGELQRRGGGGRRGRPLAHQGHRQKDRRADHRGAEGQGGRSPRRGKRRAPRTRPARWRCR